MLDLDETLKKIGGPYMKLKALGALVALTVMSIWCADDSNQKEAKVFPIRPLSAEAITHYRDTFIKKEDTRTLMKNLALGTALAGAGYMYYKWLHGPNLSQPASLHDLAHLQEQLARTKGQNEVLEERLSRLERDQDNSPNWGEWIKHKTDWVGDTLYRYTPTLIWSFGRSYVFGEISRFIWPVLPTIGSYLAEKASMNWCMIKKTHFFLAVRGLMNWTFQVMTQPDSPYHSQELIVCSNQFVYEMEKVLGYMGFVIENLPAAKLAYKDRGAATIKTVMQEVQGLIVFINGFLAVKQPTDEDMLGMIMFLKQSMFGIICQLENFEVVTLEAGLSDPEEPDMFSELKTFVFPEWQQIRPELPGKNQESEFIRKVLTQIAEQYI